MKQFSKVIVPFLVMTLIGLSAQAFQHGGVGDGGGQAIVCRNDNGEVTSAELLDLFEAEFYFLLKLKPEAKSRPYMDIARDYASVLDKAIPSAFPTSQWKNTSGTFSQSGYDVNIGMLFAHSNNYQSISDQVHRIDSEKLLIPGDAKIPPVGDSDPRILPSKKNCSIEQLAVYTDGNRQVRFIESIWNKLNNVNRAALLIHEALYRSVREMGDKNSDRTRKMVAHIFGGTKLEWIFEGVPQKFLTCWTNDAEASFRFVLYPHGKNWVTAQFLVYNGEIVLSKRVATFPAGPFANYFGMAASLENNMTMFNRIEDPLLDLPNYSVSFSIGPGSGKMSASIEALSIVGGQNEKEIVCNPALSQLNQDPDGSVEIGPAK